MKYLRHKSPPTNMSWNAPAYVIRLGSGLSFGRFEADAGMRKIAIDRFRNATNKRLLRPFMYNSFDSQNQPLQYSASLSHERQLKRSTSICLKEVQNHLATTLQSKFTAKAIVIQRPTSKSIALLACSALLDCLTIINPGLITTMMV